MRAVILITALLFTSYTYAQDLTGIWRGSFISSDRLQSLASPADRYKLEVQIDQHDKAFNSVTYSYKTTLFYGKATANGTVNLKTGKVWLEEIKIVELKMQFGSACIMTYKLQYSKNDNEEFLEGTWTGYGEKDSSFCGKGTVLLHKVLTSDFYKEPFLSNREPEKKKLTEPKKTTDSAIKKNIAGNTKKILPGNKKSGPGIANTTPAKPPATSTTPPVLTKLNPQKGSTKSSNGKPLAGKDATSKANGIAKSPPVAINPPVGKKLETDPLPADPDTIKRVAPPLKKTAPVIVPKVLASRENELVKTLIIHTKEISINIYDNGTIDHDTVSVYLDKKLVISKQMLTTSPINLKFTMDDNNDVHELVMVAENEGDIPPNTSLMVVRAGDQLFEVRITSTEQKNAVVIFKYEKAK